MDYQKISQGLAGLVRQTGQFIRQSHPLQNNRLIEEKSDNNFVTWVDKGAEERLVSGLQPLLPGAGFILEEDTIQQQVNDFTWIIDPLDGTTNYIHGIPLVCISVSLMHEDKQVLGIVYEIYKEELFSAIRGGGTFLNGHPIGVSTAGSLKSALLATGFPYYDYDRLEPYLHLFRHLMQHSHGIRRLGSAAADLAWVACGRFDGFYEYGLNPWDVAAGSLLVEEAGGLVSDFRGEKDFIWGREIIATNSAIFNEFLSTVKKYF